MLSIAGGPDLSFGVGGYVQFPKNNVVGGSNSFPGVTASALQTNGDLVVVGNNVTVSDADPAIPGSFLAFRENPDGTVDSTFSTGSLFSSPSLLTYGAAASQFPAPTNAGATAVAVLPSGKIVIVGNASGSTTPGTPLAARVIMLNADGSADTAFGTGGVVTLGAPGQGGTMLSQALAVSVLSGGQIAVGGALEPTAGGQDTPAVEVLNADGSIDTNYGTSGLATVPLPANAQSFTPIVSYTATTTGTGGGTTSFIVNPGPFNMVLAPNGDLAIAVNAALFAGTPTSVEGVVTEITTAGTPDTAFGTGGQATITPSSVISAAASVSGTALAVQSNGDLIVGGGVFFAGSPYRMFVDRLTATGVPDTTFGVGGVNILPSATTLAGANVGAIAIQADGSIILADQVASDYARLNADGSLDNTFGTAGQSVVSGSPPPILQTGPIPANPLQPSTVGLTITSSGKYLATDSSGGVRRLLAHGAVVDFTGDGITDRAIYITSQGNLAYTPSNPGFTGPIIPFGIVGTGQSLPASGAYGGEGVEEPAIYLPSLGEFAILSIPSGKVVLAPFGLSGVGNSLPAPGDYDKSGATELAIYAPSTGIYAYRPANGGPDVYIAIGATGAGQSIPVPADYLGTGQDDVAVYEPATNSFLIQNPANDQVITIPFGIAGAGNTIPVPGDYDGSGHTELAVYLPQLGEFIYRPANGGPDVTVPFGIQGTGNTLPAPGDYDGSGHTEVAAYLPTLGVFVYRPAAGNKDISEQFGVANQTIPFVLASATDSGFTRPPSGSAIHAASVSASASAEVPITQDVLDALAGPAAKKKAGGA